MTQAQVRYRSVMADSARWEDFEFREGDIVISTPPKCGTTWMQMLCALLIFQSPELPGRLTELSPWVEVLTESREAVFSALASQNHRRFIKSHTPLDGIPFDPRVTYLTVGRDPRDVAVSWVNHMDNMDLDRTFEARASAVGMDDLDELLRATDLPRSDDPRDRFWHWIEDETPVEASVSSLGIMLRHLSTFWEARDRPQVALFHYADLQADLDAEMRRLAGRLGIPVDESRWPSLVAAAGFEQMRARAEDLAPQVKVEGFWRDTRRFFNAGRSGQWDRFIERGEEARYRERVEGCAGADVVRWAHEGGRSLSPRG